MNTIKTVVFLFILFGGMTACMEEEMQDPVVDAKASVGDYTVTPGNREDVVFDDPVLAIPQVDSSLFSVIYRAKDLRQERLHLNGIPQLTGVYNLNRYKVDQPYPKALFTVYSGDAPGDRYEVIPGKPGMVDVFVTEKFVSGEFIVKVALTEGSLHLDYYPDTITIEGCFTMEF